MLFGGGDGTKNGKAAKPKKRSKFDVMIEDTTVTIAKAVAAREIELKKVLLLGDVKEELSAFGKEVRANIENLAGAALSGKKELEDRFMRIETDLLVLSNVMKEKYGPGNPPPGTVDSRVDELADRVTLLEGGVVRPASQPATPARKKEEPMDVKQEQPAVQSTPTPAAPSAVDMATIIKEGIRQGVAEAIHVFGAGRPNGEPPPRAKSAEEMAAEAEKDVGEWERIGSVDGYTQYRHRGRNEIRRIPEAWGGLAKEGVSADGLVHPVGVEIAPIPAGLYLAHFRKRTGRREPDTDATPRNGGAKKEAAKEPHKPQPVEDPGALAAVLDASPVPHPIEPPTSGRAGEEDVVAALREDGDWVQPSDLAKRFKIREKDMKALLDGLRKRGVIESAGKAGFGYRLKADEDNPE